MSSGTLRPERTRYLYSTIEVCKNVKAGPNGSIEVIVSAIHYEAPVFYFWPLNDEGQLENGQLEDLNMVIGREVGETLMTRVQVQRELFKTL